MTAESSTLNLVSSVEPLDAIPVMNELDLNETDPNETIVASSATQDQCEENEQSFDEHAASKSFTEDLLGLMPFIQRHRKNLELECQESEVYMWPEFKGQRS